MDNLDNVDTEGKFQYRIKPGIVHGDEHLNRAIEELQKIIVSNKESSEKFINDFNHLKSMLDQKEIN